MLSLEQQNVLREQYRQLNHGWLPATEQYAELVRQQLAPGKRLLDLGCGRGGLVEQLDHPVTEVVGIDPDFQSLREHRLDLSRAAALSDRLPFAANSFDLVFCSWLLEHLEYPLATFRAISRVLRPGGAFVFITPNGSHPLSLLNQGLGRFSKLQGRIVERLYGRSPSDTFSTFYRANRLVQLQKLSRDSGLTLAYWYTIADPTYLAFSPALFRLMCWFEKALSERRRLHIVGMLIKPNTR